MPDRVAVQSIGGNPVKLGERMASMPDRAAVQSVDGSPVKLEERTGSLRAGNLCVWGFCLSRGQDATNLDGDVAGMIHYGCTAENACMVVFDTE